MTNQALIDAPTSITLLLRLALGEPVTQADALSVLHQAIDRADVQRLDRVARRKARDAALLECARVLAADDRGPWTVAERLEAAIKRFDGRVWPRLRAGMPCDLGPCDMALHRAFLSGERIPRTQRRLYDLLTL